MKNKPKVGVGVIVKKGKKVLLGKRKASHGKDTWSFCGGKLEFNEEILDCAKREVSEEAGISIKNLKVGPITNDIFLKEKEHYVTVFVIADYDFGKVKVKEPKKFYEWKWFSWNSLPAPLFLPIKNLIKKGFNPFKN